MNWIKRKTRLAAVGIALACVGGLEARGGDVRPVWVDKKEDSFNARRTNDTYVFKLFRTEDTDLTSLQAGRFYPLYQYLAGEYGADMNTMSVEDISTDDYTTYRVSFKTPSGTSAVIARLVEQYDAIDFNSEHSPFFEYYQLFAIGKKDSDVLFDEVVEVEINRTLAAVMSVFPGAGQFYKGNNRKGYAMLGTGLLLAGGAVASQIRAVEWSEMMEKDPGARDSWASKSRAMKQQRNALFGTLGILSALSVYDAIKGEEFPRVRVRKSDGASVSIAPSSQSAGIALTVYF